MLDVSIEPRITRIKGIGERSPRRPGFGASPKQPRPNTHIGRCRASLKTFFEAFEIEKEPPECD
jgi:hypothetical protein